MRRNTKKSQRGGFGFFKKKKGPEEPEESEEKNKQECQEYYEKNYISGDRYLNKYEILFKKDGPTCKYTYPRDFTKYIINKDGNLSGEERDNGYNPLYEFIGKDSK